MTVGGANTGPYEFEVGERPRLLLRIQAGRVDIEEGPVGILGVEISGRGAEDVTVNGTRTLVTVEQTGRRWVGTRSVRVRVTVPPGCDVDAALTAADLWCDVALGDITARLVSGDVHAGVVYGDLEVKTASGDIDADHVEGRTKISSASGDLRVAKVGGSIECTTAAGDVRIEEAAGDIRARTASGDVIIDRFEGTDLSAKTVSGDVKVGLPSGRQVDVDLVTMSGDVRLPEGRSSASPGPRPRVRLAFHSVSGDFSVTAL